MIKREGLSVKEPLPSIKIFGFEDMILNLPVIVMRGTESIKNVNKVQKMIKELCEAWLDRSDDRLLTYTLKIEYEDRMVQISVAGEVKDISDWLEASSSMLPNDKFNDWCEKFCRRTNKIF